MKRMVRFAFSTLALTALALAVPTLALAEDAYVTANVNVRAGPDVSYPLIAQIRAGTDVDVQGCTDGWEWCDVVVYGDRGWVAGNYIEYDYDNQPVLVPMYGARLGIPIISFSVGTYWDRYYRSRPFYRERSDWSRRRIVHRPPPRPAVHPFRPARWHRSPPGHLGPVGPRHPVHADDHGRPSNSRPPSHEAPRPPSRPASGRPTHVTAPPQPHAAPSPNPRPGMPHRPGQPPGHLGPVGPGHVVHAVQPQARPAAKPAARTSPARTSPAPRPAAKGHASTPRPPARTEHASGHDKDQRDKDHKKGH